MFAGFDCFSTMGAVEIVHPLTICFCWSSPDGVWLDPAALVPVNVFWLRFSARTELLHCRPTRCLIASVSNRICLDRIP